MIDTIDHDPNEPPLKTIKLAYIIAAIFTTTLSLSACALEETERDSAACDMKIIELRLDGLDKLRYKNLCMTSLGYQRNMQNNQCNSAVIQEAVSSTCYSSSWAAWSKTSEKPN